jgi:hypothetical protein
MDMVLYVGKTEDLLHTITGQTLQHFTEEIRANEQIIQSSRETLQRSTAENRKCVTDVQLCRSELTSSGQTFKRFVEEIRANEQIIQSSHETLQRSTAENRKCVTDVQKCQDDLNSCGQTLQRSTEENRECKRDEDKKIQDLLTEKVSDSEHFQDSLTKFLEEKQKLAPIWAFLCSLVSRMFHDDCKMNVFRIIETYHVKFYIVMFFTYSYFFWFCDNFTGDHVGVTFKWWIILTEFVSIFLHWRHPSRFKSPINIVRCMDRICSTEQTSPKHVKCGIEMSKIEGEKRISEFFTLNSSVALLFFVFAFSGVCLVDCIFSWRNQMCVEYRYVFAYCQQLLILVITIRGWIFPFCVRVMGQNGDDDFVWMGQWQGRLWLLRMYVKVLYLIQCVCITDLLSDPVGFFNKHSWILALEGLYYYWHHYCSNYHVWLCEIISKLSSQCSNYHVWLCRIISSLSSQFQVWRRNNPSLSQKLALSCIILLALGCIFVFLILFPFR